MSLPPTSLITTSRNRPELLADTVDSILHGSEIPNEIIVVDNSEAPHPTLRNGEIVRGCEIRYLWIKERGLSHGLNVGIAAARNNLLVLIDDDMFVEPTWLTAIVSAQVNGGLRSVVTGQVKPYLTEKGGFAPATRVDDTPAVYQGRIGKDVLLSGNMAMYSSMVQTVGLFDERLGSGTLFPAGGDNDFGFRVLEAGCRIIYVPEAIVYHRAWRTDKDYLPLRWAYGVGTGAFYAKHFNLRDRYILNQMRLNIQNHLLAFPWHLHRERLRAYGDIVLSWAILVGAFRWWRVYGMVSSGAQK